MKKFLNFLEKYAMKMLAIGAVGFGALMIIFGGSISGYGLETWLLLAALVSIFLGVVGIVVKAVHKTMDGVKSFGKKMKTKFAKSTSVKKSNKNDDVITLTSANGENIDFVEIAGIAYGGKFYAILQPVKLLDGMSKDEALVFQVTRNPRGEDTYKIELNDAIIDAVFREYNKLLDAQRK